MEGLRGNKVVEQLWERKLWNKSSIYTQFHVKRYDMTGCVISSDLFAFLEYYGFIIEL